MTEEKYITFDRYRADPADFRAELDTMRTELNVEIVEMQKAIGGQTKWLAGLVIVLMVLSLTLVKLL
jgi:hypothetical protein